MPEPKMKLRIKVGSMEEAGALLTDLARTDVLAGDVVSVYEPSLGLYYEPEMIGSEEWLSPTSLLRRGFGDCEDLARARVGELLSLGAEARVEVVKTGPSRWHAVVARPMPDGTKVIEDPSAALKPTSKQRRRYRQKVRRRKDGQYEVAIQTGPIQAKAKGKSKRSAASKAFGALSKVASDPLVKSLIPSPLNTAIELGKALGLKKVGKKIGKAAKKVGKKLWKGLKSLF